MIVLHAATAAGAAVAGAGSGWFVPALIARIPQVEPDLDGEEGPTPRVEVETFAAVAARPGLAARCAVAGAVVAGLLGQALGWQWPLLVVLALVPVSLALAVVDWRTRLLPTWLIAPTYAGTLVLVLLTWTLEGSGDPAPLWRALIGWAVAGGFFGVLWLVHPAGMGYGDVRLSGILGIALGYLGWAELAIGIYGGFLLGGVLGGLLSLLGRIDRLGYPFGPFMLAGALVGIVLGPNLAEAVLPR